MARFEPQTFSDILRRMINRVVARSNLTDVVEGSDLHVMLAAVARELDDISYQMTNLQRVWDIDTAQREDLDARGEDLNPDEISRLTAAKATGSVVFSRSGTTGVVTIPQGTKVRVPDDGPEFETTAAGSITGGNTDSASIAVQAVESGADGNVESGTITEMDAITGVETVTNAAATSGGQDEETDGQYRARMKSYMRSLSRGTPSALTYAVLGTALDGYGRIVTMDLLEGEGADLGKVWIYVDDGAGTVSVTDTLAATETVLASASGGELRVYLDNFPVVQGETLTVRWTDSTAGPTTYTLVEDDDYTLNYATGQITLVPGGSTSIPTTGLNAGDAIDCTAYTWYEGLIAEAQKIVDGDSSDRANYPGYRAAGTQVFVLPPVVLQQTVVGEVTVEQGFDKATLLTTAQQAINRYINGLGVNGDVILSELVYVVQSIPGVYDVSFTSPVGNVTIGSGELARVTDDNIDLT